MTRRWEIDALRGLMLVLMTLTHLPTRFSDPTGQPFGFVSAAEGFVMLSGYMAGMVYTRKARQKGHAVIPGAFLRRALKIYLCQAGLLLFLFTLIAIVGLMARQEAVTNLLSFYLAHPLQAFISGMLLVYNPPLLDILPMYILLMLVSPLVLLHGLHRGWGGVLGLSLLLWLAAQFDLPHLLYDRMAEASSLQWMPFAELGSFKLFAWQFLWLLGLWMGASGADDGPTPGWDFPRWMVNTALAVATVMLIWRHAVGQVPFSEPSAFNLLFDKWQLGPVRLMNFCALLVLVMHFGPWLKTRLPRVTALETLGKASLPVFCMHLLLALVALTIFGSSTPERPVWIDVVILAATLGVLYGVAWGSLRIDARAAEARKKLAARRQMRRGPHAPAA
ncbi:OpgC domain-containing protein [Ideonella azotifigens]|uniref:OpgC domain-containing protein n=2 Tax=Ideonella azotifigens TaxID=513160 RepID=A0ABN1KHL0_9BURK|nr:OpgC domain-containing protein [Ideonella azotifigens]MCD2344200.1 OpgC domain-containing protein [Ideonella azotifigens]